MMKATPTISRLLTRSSNRVLAASSPSLSHPVPVSYPHLTSLLLHSSSTSTSSAAGQTLQLAYRNGPTSHSASFSTSSRSHQQAVAPAAPQGSPVPAAAAAADMPGLYADMAGRLDARLLGALDAMGYKNMTPVQQQVLNMPSFTQDCLVQAKTGTGKTIAFLLPALHTLLNAKNLDRSQVSLLIMAPTRELAQQIADECEKLVSQCNPRFECHLAVGGNAKASALNKFLKGKPTILVATPGRLNDYLSDERVRSKFEGLRCLVLDEADCMLDAGFLPALTKILQSLPAKRQAGWQGMCFSATLPPSIHKVLHHVLAPKHTHISTIDENEAPTINSVPQSCIQVDSANDVLPTLHKLLSAELFDSNKKLKAVVFSSTARQTALLYTIFGHTGGASPAKLPVWQMQSRMSQAQRNKATEDFKKTESGILFASDVVGRGLDFPDIHLVVQVGIPLDSEQYVHRVGRTGRAGKGGRAVMIITPEDSWFVQKNSKFPITPLELDHPKAAKIDSASIISQALPKVPDAVKTAAYSSYLGFVKTMMSKMKITPIQVVQIANNYAYSLGCEEPPVLESRTISKMGLKGVPGLNTTNGPSQGPSQKSQRNGNGGGKRVGYPPPSSGGSLSKRPRF
ncbi:P-loop containing nucleoside triphosphate hydrolase protein [Sordaria brevicollis]|uniref:ATP-dependent RNA helicase n=1 Tax=Sordaria brevicollis TaxID=83679 RepID=A0AAE0PNZ0_SORBR|nr:P-loop containing nucleoside triphosphate hydrolase protein [Sordaria brevicollis]